MSSIRFRYEPDPEDDFDGRLWLNLKTDRFSGCGFFWAHRGDVSGLADQLSAYPLSGSEPPVYRAGYVDSAILAVSITPVGGVGDLLVQAMVSDLYDAEQRVTASFNTTYMEVAAFREQLRSLAEGQADEAVLIGR